MFDADEDSVGGRFVGLYIEERSFAFLKTYDGVLLFYERVEFQEVGTDEGFDGVEVGDGVAIFHWEEGADHLGKGDTCTVVAEREVAAVSAGDDVTAACVRRGEVVATGGFQEGSHEGELGVEKGCSVHGIYVFYDWSVGANIGGVSAKGWQSDTKNKGLLPQAQRKNVKLC